MWAPVRRRAAASVCACMGLLLAHAGVAQNPGLRIPSGRVTTLDGHAVILPGQLSGRANVLIVGFGRHSQSATTAWEKSVRLQLAHPPQIGFYDIAMLAEIPGFLRPFVLRRIGKAVPDVLKPNFIPVFDQEDAWKRVAGYASDQPEAAYVLLVDASGRVRWLTHTAFTPAMFSQLSDKAHQLVSEQH